MSSRQPETTTTMAVVHRTGAVWRAVAACTEPTDAGAIRVVATRSFNDAEASRLDSWLDEQGVSRVICVLPASSVICRTVSLPKAPDEQLEPALRLQAESHLLGMAPPHRMGIAVLPATQTETGRAGLILAWPESASAPHPPTNRPVTYAPDVAGVAALLRDTRPTEPLMWLDRDSGSLAMAMAHANGVTVRGTREQNASPEQWSRSVGRVVAETALNVGLADSFVTSMVDTVQSRVARMNGRSQMLMLPADVARLASERVHGADDEQWWSQYGIAAGVALATLGPTAPLTEMLDEQPQAAPSPVERVIERLAQPRRAAYVVAACVLAIAVAPVVFAALRYAVLSVRFGDVEEHLATVNEAEVQLAMYNRLMSDGWPMTKLLADLASSTPVGIKLDSVRFNRPQGTVAIVGSAVDHADASASQLIGRMKSQMEETGIFRSVDAKIEQDSKWGTYTFDLTARISQAHLPVNYPIERDFGRWTMVDRRDGEPPPEGEIVPEELIEQESALVSAAQNSRTEPAAASSGGSARPSSTSSAQASVTPAPPRNDRNRSGITTGRPDSGDEPPRRAGGRRGGLHVGGMSGDGGAAERSDIRTREGVQNPHEIPDPISQAQIDAMTTRAQVLEHLSKVAKVKSSPNVEPEVAARLNKEFEMLMARLKELK